MTFYFSGLDTRFILFEVLIKMFANKTFEKELENEIIRMRELLIDELEVWVKNKLGYNLNRIPKIERYHNCDIMIHKNDLGPYGFAATYTEEEMIALAMKHGSRIVVKNGKKGKWYLKGMGKSTEYLQTQIDKKIGKFRDGVYCLLLEY